VERAPSAAKPASFALASAAAVGAALAAAGVGAALKAGLESPRFAPSTSTLALVLGAVLGALPGVRARLADGVKRVSKAAIPVAIVLIGFGLDAKAFAQGDSLVSGLVAVLLAMSVAFAAAMAFGRLLGLDSKTSVLLAAGTAVCGNSAIMAVAPAVKPRDEDVALTVGVVNVLSVLLLFGLPPLAGMLGLEGTRGGAVAGLTIHALPQALAAGESIGPAALEAATLYKLMRVSMLAPLVLAVTWAFREQGSEDQGSGRVGVPVFLLLFVAAAAARSAGLVDGSISLGGAERALWEWATVGGKAFLAVALAAIGVGLDVRTLLRVGPRVLAAGLAAVGLLVGTSALLVTWLL
jgi:uncharacterized integral membrane protein (TIGR00698 family)